MTRKQRVLQELIDAYNGKKYEYSYTSWISGGWTPIGAIVNPNIGGSEGTRRVRELKAKGIKIDCRYYYRKGENGEKMRTNTTIYKLLTDPELIDTDKCELKPVKNGQMSYLESYKL